MSKIFISYRRDDSEAVTGRIYDRLAPHYGKQSVLMDIDNIPVGMDFRDCLNEHLRQCAIMLAVVGQRWYGPDQRWWMPGRKSRLDDEMDWVRIEIESALKRKIPLVPVLVNKAEMPKANQLPPPLRDFVFRQAATIGGPQDFHAHVDRLIRAIDEILLHASRSAPVVGDQRPDGGQRTVPAPDIVVPRSSIEVPTENARPSSVSAGPEPLQETIQETVQETSEAAPRPEPARRYADAPTDRQAGPSIGRDDADTATLSPRDRHLFGPGRKQVLAIDGAGVRGVISLAFLERIETLMAERAGGSNSLSDHFDLIGGSSVGAFLATMLALGHSAGDLKNVFIHFAPMVFKRSFWSVAGLSAKFDSRKWGAEIEKVCGDRSLDTPDLKTGLCVVTKRMDTGSSWVLMNNPRAPYWEPPTDRSHFGNRRYRLADLVRASTAAPGYFEPVELPMMTGEMKGLFVDGSTGIHGNPALIMFLITLLRSYGLCWPTGPEHLTIASIGAGSFRLDLSGGQPGFARQLWLMLNSLVSLIHESENFVLTQMQLFGESPTPWRTNSEVGSLGGDSPPGGKWFRFLRYDVRLEHPWLRELGIDVSAAQLQRLRRTDDPSIIADLYEIGRLAAQQQVKSEHWSDGPQ